MSNHFLSINRGKDGLKSSDVTTGSSSTAGDDVELRIADGASLKRLDVIKALEAFRRFLENKNTSNFPPL